MTTWGEYVAEAEQYRLYKQRCEHLAEKWMAAEQRCEQLEAQLADIRRQMESQREAGNWPLFKVVQQCDQLETENARLRRALVEHHSIANLSDAVVREGFGAPGGCPVCAKAVLASGGDQP